MSSHSNISSASYAESQIESVLDVTDTQQKSLSDKISPSDIEASTEGKASESSPSPTVEQTDIVHNYGPKIPLTNARRSFVFLAISVTVFLAALDQTIVTTTLPAIAKDFSNFSDISWVGTAYLISTTAVQPIYGVMSNMFGRKRALLFACAVFLLGSSLCGAAQSMIMLIISRVVQGLGGSGIVSLANIITADIIPLRQRGMYQGVLAMVYALAAVLGPLLGGVFSDYASWRWAFYINLPIGAVATMMLMALLHLQRPKDVPFVTNVLSLDFMGIFLLVVSIVMVLLGLSWGADAKYPWNSSIILSLLIVGAVLGVLFLLNEWRQAKRPIIPLRLFGTLSLVATYVDVFLQGFIFLGLLFFLPLYYQAVHGSTAVQSGIELIPFVIAQALVAAIVGALMSRWGIYKEFTVAGFVVGTISGGLLTILDENTPKGAVIVVLLVAGISQGLTISSMLLGIHAQVKDQSDIAFGTSLWIFLRTLGGVFGIAIGSTFLQSSLTNAGKGEYAQNIKVIADLPAEIRMPVLEAFVTGLHRFFILLAVLSGLGLLASLFIKKVKMGSKKQQQQQQQQKGDEGMSEEEEKDKALKPVLLAE